MHDDPVVRGPMDDRRHLHPANVEIDLRRLLMLCEQRLHGLRTLVEDFGREVRLHRLRVTPLIGAVHEKIRHLRAL